MCLKTSCLPYLIQVRLKRNPKISFLKQVSLNLLGKKGGRGNFFLSLLVF